MAVPSPPSLSARTGPYTVLWRFSTTPEEPRGQAVVLQGIPSKIVDLAQCRVNPANRAALTLG